MDLYEVPLSLSLLGNMLAKLHMLLRDSFALIECFSDGSCRVSHLVEPLCYGVI